MRGKSYICPEASTPIMDQESQVLQNIMKIIELVSSSCIKHPHPHWSSCNSPRCHPQDVWPSGNHPLSC